MFKIILKSVFHNCNVLLVGFVFAYLCSKLDSVLKIEEFHGMVFTIIAVFLLMIGFLIRVWATIFFYKYKMDVISLKPQEVLLTSGPYRFSRNPLYVGGNIFIFLGAMFLFGSPSGLVLTVLHLPLMDMMVRREEKQLAKKFGSKWKVYTKQVRRWI